MARITKQWLWPLAAGLLLGGCTAGFEQFQGDQAKARTEFQHMRTEQRERDNYAACVNVGALPGSTENLECQLEMARKQEQAAKLQNPTDKSH